HLVIEEYLAPVDQPVSLGEGENFIVPLSARTPEQLQQRACDLLEFIHTAKLEQSAGSKALDLEAISYTLQIGRELMEERLGFVVKSINQLEEKLAAYIDGDKNIEDSYHGRVE